MSEPEKDTAQQETLEEWLLRVAGEINQQWETFAPASGYVVGRRYHLTGHRLRMFAAALYGAKQLLADAHCHIMNAAMEQGRHPATEQPEPNTCKQCGRVVPGRLEQGYCGHCFLKHAGPAVPAPQEHRAPACAICQVHTYALAAGLCRHCRKAHQQGYAEGRVAGAPLARQEGFLAGHAEGYKKGHAAGAEEGHEKGHRDILRAIEQVVELPQS